MKTQSFKLSVLAIAISLSSGLAMATTPDTDSVPAVQNTTATMTQTNDREQLQTGEKPDNAGETGAINQNRMRHQTREHAGKEDRPELFSTEERAEFRDSMRAAETMEERHALRDSMRATRMERAEAAGIELPDRSGMGMHGQRPERPSMADKGSHGRSGH